MLGLGSTYMITSLPTLATFDRGELVRESVVTDVRMMADRAWLRRHVEKEAGRKGEGSGGDGWGGGAGTVAERAGSVFGGLFGR
jgi:hypothetical protein